MDRILQLRSLTLYLPERVCLTSRHSLSWRSSRSAARR